jgi:4-amino-4-deoxy-L-arabinose transferase-like glycosyltransferase
MRPVWRIDAVFLALLLAALLIRLDLAVTRPYIHDEDNNAIPLARSISFAPGQLNLPIRGENHLALPAYVVKASSTLFGTTPLGYRLLHLLAGLATIALIYALTNQWYGSVAARWAAALLAFNEYYLGVSARATAHAPQLLLIAAAFYAFSRFLAVQRAAYLYAAGAFVGLAFYCKEHSALLLPVFLAALLQAKYRHWLRGPHAYLACAVFVLVISPDLFWNAKTDSATVLVTYGDRPALQATYGSHLRRLGGLGLSPYPAMFYAHAVVRALHLRLTGQPLYDETPEYAAMNAAVGALLLAAVLVTTVRRRGRSPIGVFLLIAFWGLFGFFTLIKKGDPPGRLAPVSWMWVEMTLVPAVVLAGGALAGVTGKWRIAVWACGAGALLYATVWTLGWLPW